MRVVHFADNHLGAGIDRREKDILDSFAESIDRIIDLKPDLVINAGDLFHKVHPSNRVIAFASEHLLRLGRETGIPTLIISGNHDAPKQTQIWAVLSIFKDFENIHVVYNSRYERITIGDCAVSAVPHCLTTDILRDELDKIAPDEKARYNILVLHGVVGGIKEFKMADLSEQMIDSKYFHRGFDYVALGHYHNYTRVEKNVYYSGSTERLSQSEADHAKGFIEINLDESDEAKRIVFHRLKSRVMIDLPVMKTDGKSAEEIVSDLEMTIKRQNPEDKIVRIKVADISEETYRALPFDRIAKLKEDAFSLDIRFEKKEKSEENLYADLNLGRLDLAFEKFLETQIVEHLDQDRLKEAALHYLHCAESEDDR